MLRYTATKPKTKEQRELEQLKQAIAELQAREKVRDPAYRPKVDLSERAQPKAK